MRFHDSEILVIEFVGEQSKEPHESLRAELPRVVVGELSKLLEVADKQLQNLNGPSQDGVRRGP